MKLDKYDAAFELKVTLIGVEHWLKLSFNLT